jgi:hypothetical protein
VYMSGQKVCWIQWIQAGVTVAGVYFIILRIYIYV